MRSPEPNFRERIAKLCFAPGFLRKFYADGRSRHTRTRTNRTRQLGVKASNLLPSSPASDCGRLRLVELPVALVIPPAFLCSQSKHCQHARKFAPGAMSSIMDATD
jgi:hypothetical protein